jgi:hypothetical protein
MTEMRILYNLTSHNQSELAILPHVASRWNVELQSRCRIVDPENWPAMKGMIRNAVRGIPPGSDVIIGGLTQTQALVVELRLFNIFYVCMKKDGSGRSRPVGVIPHRGWTRSERFEIEQHGVLQEQGVM